MTGHWETLQADTLSQFRDAVRTTGLEPPEFIEPGKLHRFPGAGKRASNTAAWCILFWDGQGGCFGDWSRGLSRTWRAKRKKPLTHFGRTAFLYRVNKARAQAEKDRKAKQDDAANRASMIWNVAAPARSGHAYLIQKMIGAHTARLHKDLLVLPVMNFTGRLTSLQFISPDGRKRLLSGGRKRGCFIPVTDDRAKTSRVIVCEGWATGCTLAEDEPTALVLAAIDTGNLEPVAVSARHRWPSAELIIAGDDDRRTQGNPGATKAQTAAIAAGAVLALPQWPEDAPAGLTDFNDLAIWLTGVAT